MKWIEAKVVFDTDDSTLAGELIGFRPLLEQQSIDRERDRGRGCGRESREARQPLGVEQVRQRGRARSRGCESGSVAAAGSRLYRQVGIIPRYRMRIRRVFENSLKAL